jgi:hypothetical protein
MTANTTITTNAKKKNHLQMLIYSPTMMTSQIHRRVLSYENLDDLNAKLDQVFVESSNRDNIGDNSDGTENVKYDFE